MRYDRDYYRAQPSRALVEEAGFCINVDWKELAIALAERLQDTHEKLEAMRYDVMSERHNYDSYDS